MKHHLTLEKLRIIKYQGSKILHFRYDFRTRKTIPKEDAEKMGIKMKDQKDVTLETEYEKIAKVCYVELAYMIQTVSAVLDCTI